MTTEERLDRLERAICLLERSIAVHAKSAAGLSVTGEDYGDIREMARAIEDIRFDVTRPNLVKEPRT